MSLFSDTSSILEELSIDYDENKVATYDDYYDDMYAIKSNKLSMLLDPQNNACPKLGDAFHNEYDPLIPSTFDKKIYYDDSMPPIYDDYYDESGFRRVSTLGSSDPTILEGVESHYNIDER